MADRFVAGFQIGWQAATDWLYFGRRGWCSSQVPLSSQFVSSVDCCSQKGEIYFIADWPAALHSDSTCREKQEHCISLPSSRPKICVAKMSFNVISRDMSLQETKKMQDGDKRHKILLMIKHLKTFLHFKFSINMLLLTVKAVHFTVWLWSGFFSSLTLIFNSLSCRKTLSSLTEAVLNG